MSLVQFPGLLRPNPSCGIPLYVQLMDQVKHGLLSGALRPGDPLPVVRRLAEALVISPGTVARAYRELAGEGLIDLGHDAGARLACTPGLPERSHSQADPRRFADAGMRLSELTDENRCLASMIAAEVADRARRDRDLESAREVQQRLLPQAYPPIAGLDYAGACRPALGVGGDYYDFIRLSGNRMAIAVGDVSGKGFPAALLMTTLRAYLHGQMLQTTEPAEVMATLNRHACESFSPNRYATFFYADYEASTRALRYVNAGHNPPFLFRTRRSRREILRLHPGGPVVGFMPDCVYVEERVTLEPDDLIVAFTDGISEAMNEDGDQWGEERLAAAIGASRGASARELIDRIISGADEFAAGTSQHDDMTLVVLRVA